MTQASKYSTSLVHTIEKSHNACDVVSMVPGKLEPKAAHCQAILKVKTWIEKKMFSDSLIVSQNKAQTHIKSYDNKSTQQQSMAQWLALWCVGQSYWVSTLKELHAQCSMCLWRKTWKKNLKLKVKIKTEKYSTGAKNALDGAKRLDTAEERQ